MDEREMKRFQGDGQKPGRTLLPKVADWGCDHMEPLLHSLQGHDA